MFDWLKCLGRLRRYDLVEGGVTWVDLRFEKAHPIPSVLFLLVACGLRCELSADLPANKPATFIPC